MLYYNILTGEYPRYQGDLELMGWIDGQPLPDGWVNVHSTEMPTIGENEKIVENLPELIDGIYYQKFEVVALTQTEIEAKNAPITARKKLEDLGFTPAEIAAIVLGLVR